MGSTEVTETGAYDSADNEADQAGNTASFGGDGARSPGASLLDQAIGPISRGARNVLRSPVRLALVAAILGTSLMFVATMVALNASAQQRLSSARAQIGTGITISPAGSGQGPSSTGQYITSVQVKTVEGITGVTSVSEFVTTRDTSGTIKSSITIPANAPTFGGGFGGGNRVISPSIEGVITSGSLALESGVTPTLKSGRQLTTADANANVALTSQALAKANGYTLGSTFSLSGTKVTLVGLFTTGDSFDDNTIVLPLATTQRIYKINGVTRLTAYADSDTDVAAVVSRLQKALGSGLDVVSQSQAYTDTLNALRSAQQTIQTTLIVSAITAALIIIFAVFLIVRERTQEIGLLRAIGASHLQIVSQFVVETLTLGITAAIAATILIALFAGTIAKQFPISTGGSLARGAGRVFTRGGNFTPPAGGFGGGGFGGRLGAAATQTLSAGLTPTTLLLVFGLGVGLAIIASAIPAWYVARVRPAEALRQSAG